MSIGHCYRMTHDTDANPALQAEDREAWQFDKYHETNSSLFTDTEAVLERDSTLHTNALRQLPRPVSGTLW